MTYLFISDLVRCDHCRKTLLYIYKRVKCNKYYPTNGYILMHATDVAETAISMHSYLLFDQSDVCLHCFYTPV